MKKFLKILLLINTLFTIATVSNIILNAVEPVKVSDQTISILENSKKETPENFENDEKAISPEIVWKDYDSGNMLIASVANSTPKNNNSDVLNKFKNKNSTTKIVNLKNNFNFKVKHSELNEKKKSKQNGPHKLEVYN